MMEFHLSNGQERKENVSATRPHFEATPPSALLSTTKRLAATPWGGGSGGRGGEVVAAARGENPPRPKGDVLPAETGEHVLCSNRNSECGSSRTGSDDQIPHHPPVQRREERQMGRRSGDACLPNRHRPALVRVGRHHDPPRRSRRPRPPAANYSLECIPPPHSTTRLAVLAHRPACPLHTGTGGGGGWGGERRTAARPRRIIREACPRRPARGLAARGGSRLRPALAAAPPSFLQGERAKGSRCAPGRRRQRPRGGGTRGGRVGGDVGIFEPLCEGGGRWGRPLEGDGRARPPQPATAGGRRRPKNRSKEKKKKSRRKGGREHVPEARVAPWRLAPCAAWRPPSLWRGVPRRRVVPPGAPEAPYVQSRGWGCPTISPRAHHRPPPLFPSPSCSPLPPRQLSTPPPLQLSPS